MGGAVRAAAQRAGWFPLRRAPLRPAACAAACLARPRRISSPPGVLEPGPHLDGLLERGGGAAIVFVVKGVAAAAGQQVRNGADVWEETGTRGQGQGRPAAGRAQRRREGEEAHACHGCRGSQGSAPLGDRRVGALDGHADGVGAPVAGQAEGKQGGRGLRGRPLLQHSGGAAASAARPGGLPTCPASVSTRPHAQGVAPGAAEDAVKLRRGGGEEEGQRGGTSRQAGRQAGRRLRAGSASLPRARARSSGGGCGARGAVSPSRSR